MKQGLFVPYTETYVDEGRPDDALPTSPTLSHHPRFYDENLSADFDGRTAAGTPDSTAPRARTGKQSTRPSWHWIRPSRADTDLQYARGDSHYNQNDDDDIRNLRADLSQKRLNDVHVHLWWVGRQGNIRPLHHQKAMFREIVVTERAYLHMVWFENSIFLKPLPEYLLDRAWFEKKICQDEELYKLACGFLYSYARLIMYRSDHSIAIEAKLLPEYMDWVRWCRFSKEIREGVNFGMINKRYRYGELRLKRLNHVYRFCKGQVRGFYSLDRGYNSFFRRNFGWMVGLFAFLTIILTAMQVVLATAQGQGGAGQGLFDKVSYVFGVMSIIIPVVMTGTALALFFVLFWWHFVKTLLYKKQVQTKRRLKEQDLEQGRRTEERTG